VKGDKRFLEFYRFRCFQENPKNKNIPTLKTMYERLNYVAKAKWCQKVYNVHRNHYLPTIEKIPATIGLQLVCLCSSFGDKSKMLKNLAEMLPETTSERKLLRKT